MAKRAAAGTLALAVCLTGGLVSAGAANAAFTAATGEATLSGSAPINGTAAAQTGISAGVLTATIPTATQNNAATTVTFTLNNGATFNAAGSASVTDANGATTAGVTPTVAGGVLTVVIPAGTAATGTASVAVTGATINTTANTAGNSRTIVGVVGGANVTDAVVNSTLVTQIGGDLATTASTGSVTVAAPQVIKASGQALADVTLTIPASSTASWSTGDRILFALPDGLTFSGTPTITASKIAGDGSALPTFSAGVATQTAAGAPSAIPLNRQVAFSFTNTDGTTTADNGTSYKLVISGIKADIATTYANDNVLLGALGGSNAQLYYQAQTASSPQTFGAAADLNANGNDVLAYVVPASISVASGSTFVNGGGIQAAPAVTITESTAASIATGTTAIGFRFTDATGAVVPLDSITGAGFVPTLTVNGAAVTSPSFSVTNNVLTVSPTFTAAIDTIVIGNVRFAASGTTFVGPLKAELVTPAVSQVNSVAGNTATSGAIAVNIPTNRLGGATRFDTAAQVAATAFPGTGLTRFVLANGSSDGVDALSGNFQAGVGTDAPVVLVQANGIPSPSLAFIVSKVPAASSSVPQTITFDVVGGEDAVSDTVRNALRAAFPSSSNYTLVFRDNAGDDRYDTAAKVAINAGAANVNSFTGTFGQAAKKTAILASGVSTADAVTVGGISYKAGFPLLLTRADAVPAATLSAIQTLGITQVIVVGGTTVVSSAVETQLTGAGVSVIRIQGDDRYATATAVANFARTPVASTTTTAGAGLGYNGAALSGTTLTHTDTDVLLASGSALADILAAGQLSGRGTSGVEYFPVLTTGASALPTTTVSFITTNKDDITNVRGIGGADALPASVLSAAANAAN